MGNKKKPILGVYRSVRARSGSLRLQAMSRTSPSSDSGGSDFWSASDQTAETSGSFKSRSSSAALISTDQPELDLLASEILSLSDEDCASDVTPTFSDNSEAPQAAAALSVSGWWSWEAHCLVADAASKLPCHAGPQDTGKVEDIAKQLDFGSASTLIQVGNQQESPDQADAAAACGTNLTQDLECYVSPTPEDAATASQSQFALCCEELDSDSNSSSSSHHVLQSTAASARPSCRRRAALDSDSDSEQVSTQYQEGGTQLLTQVPSTSVYSFDVSDSDDASDADSPRAGPSLPFEASLTSAAVHQHKQGVPDQNVIVLSSSEEEDDVASCRQNSDRLYRWVGVCCKVHSRTVHSHSSVQRGCLVCPFLRLLPGNEGRGDGGGGGGGKRQALRCLCVCVYMIT